jgi:hypothetical protein
MGVIKGCEPRKEVLKGDLQDAIFAADFGNLIAGNAPAVYADPQGFFANTHPAEALRKIVRMVFERLADTEESGATVRLSTGFGGGKTHTLMALWHLANHVGDPSLGTELLPAAGRPKQVRVFAVDAGKAGIPVFAVHEGLKVHSLWGELFFQMGGSAAVAELGAADNPEGSPYEALIEAVLPKEPTLILLDELVIYMAALSDAGQGNLLKFLNSLASVVGKRSQAMLLVTDPGAQQAYAQQTGALQTQLAAAATRLDQVLGRKDTDIDPIGDESSQVIVRRLFASVDKTAAETESALYHDLFDRVSKEQPGLVPPRSIQADYARRIVECYPFHPRLLETAEGRLGAIQDFQKSRGVLRLFARILRGIWERQADLDLITAGDLDWASDRIQADLLQRLGKDRFKAAVSSDVIQHARDLDGGTVGGVHQRAASALLLESLPLTPNSGLDPAELTLAVLRPDEAGQEPADALNRLAGVCWHTYPMLGGRGWQFRYEPNVIKQIEERMGDIDGDEARSRVLAEVQEYFSGPGFKITAWPAKARQVPESSDLQVVLCEDETLARTVCALSDDTDPQAPIPRRFQNAIVAVSTRSGALNTATERAKRLLAAEAIGRENRTGDQGRLIREQLQRIMPELQRQFGLASRRAFDRIHLSGGAAWTLEEAFQVPDEQILKRPEGQASLRRFLNEKGLMYQPGDAIDPDRLLKDILPGAVPVAGQADVYTAKAVHERLLSAPGLRLIPGPDLVRQTLLKALQGGKLAIRLADDRAYDATGCTQGPPGQRRRSSSVLTTMTLDDTTLVAAAASAEAADWLREDKPKNIGDGDGQGGGSTGAGPIPKPPSSTAIASSWEQVRELAMTRPLRELRLTASRPPAAATLATLAQPLGANSLALSVTFSGELKDGGRADFAANDLKLTSPIKPLAVVQTLFNSAAEGAVYNAELALGFGSEGRSDLGDALLGIADSASAEVAPMATFGPEPGGTQ